LNSELLDGNHILQMLSNV